MSKKHGKRACSKRNRVPKGDVVWRQTAEEATLARKPYYNAFACGHGVHGDTKYNRAKEKRTWKRDLQKGASRGSFLYGKSMWLEKMRRLTHCRVLCVCTIDHEEHPFGLQSSVWQRCMLIQK